MTLPWGAIGSVASGLLGVGGQAATNRANAKMAREQMRFQERMSGTAIQRGMADAQAAGVNPLLALGNPASSPGGASATMGDPISAGLSSAESARRTNTELAVMELTGEKIRNEADAAKWNAKRAKTEAQVAADIQPSLTEALFEENTGRARDARFRGVMQPQELRSIEALNQRLEDENVGIRNEARLQRNMGTWAPALGLLTSSVPALGSILGGLSRGMKRAPVGNRTVKYGVDGKGNPFDEVIETTPIFKRPP